MLRPIDLALNIGNAQAMRGGEAQNARPEIAMQQFADRLEKQVKAGQEQVIRQEAPQKSNVNKDREGQGKGYKPKAKQKPKEETKKDKAVVRESMFDMLV